jgi:DNA polymerase III delta prime subunit
MTKSLCVSTNDDEFLWSQKYRPQKVKECILPETIKTKVSDFVAKGEIPNFMFCGSAGCGKTTLAKAIANELDADMLYINASMESGIDVLRSKIQQFASSVSFSGGTKLVLLDEADYSNAQSFQPALRGFMETFSSNCRFIFTCNYKNKIIEPLHSRCNVIEFKIENKDRPALLSQMYKRVCEILRLESVDFDQKVVAELISKHFPDNRKILNELQRYSSGGVIDSGILVNLSDESYKELTNCLKNKQFGEVRKWVSRYGEGENVSVFRKLYDTASTYLEPQSVPQLILILADYQHRDAFVADHEINLMACLTEIMSSCNFR